MASPTAVFRKNATALITGAASGVGLAVAKLCASHSMNIYLVDNNKEALNSAKESVKSSGTVNTHVLDVANLEDWATLRKKVEGEGKKLDFLHLNAGIGLKSDWTDAAYFQKIFDVPRKAPLSSLPFIIISHHLRADRVLTCSPMGQTTGELIRSRQRHQHLLPPF